MPERSNGAVSKTVVLLTGGPRVRIPPSPPLQSLSGHCVCATVRDKRLKQPGLRSHDADLALGGLDALRGRADLGLRFKADALGLEAAMVDPRVDVEFGQPLVDMIGPTLTPLLDQLGAVPPRAFGPKPFSSTDRMVSMTWAWGLGWPSSATSQ